MSKLLVVTVVTWGMVVSAASAGYVINGDLTDWGVTPFSSWAPAGTADYTQTDNINLYNAESYDEYYDYEAMYFDDDPSRFYFGVVCSYPIATQTGDLGLDFNNDWTISEHGVVTGLDYAIRIGTAPQGQVVLNPNWTNTIHWKWSDGWQGSPYQIVDSTGTVVGTATVASEYYPDMESASHILEVSVDRSLFPNGGGDANDVLGIHLSLFCGNDSINLLGTIDSDPYNPPPPPPPAPPAVPVPATLLLVCLGTGVVGGLRRRKLM